MPVPACCLSVSCCPPQNAGVPGHYMHLQPKSKGIRPGLLIFEETAAALRTRPPTGSSTAAAYVLHRVCFNPRAKSLYAPDFASGSQYEKYRIKISEYTVLFKEIPPSCNETTFGHHEQRVTASCGAPQCIFAAVAYDFRDTIRLSGLCHPQPRLLIPHFSIPPPASCINNPTICQKAHHSLQVDTIPVLCYFLTC